MTSPHSPTKQTRSNSHLYTHSPQRLEAGPVGYVETMKDLWWSPSNAIDEWKHGSKRRLLKYYGLSVLAGVIVGAIIIVIIWAIRRNR
ncbi:hypothetical protein BU24DRAFT_428934 [Aaosphaeria arxii CBS 175.79]|uniref:Uncharacterized protein n=1 Tax=Aaosphaeria arxii CBS 175.79 TaxID=1450172 RepID=A0A6A5X7R6_9PLEO|nr:uncharacterized protein BU24DRAFT_428934 [Aaosphaeria arxii CBS 175.79]KAF2008961.1 hypothetical protein BU24DRAFT_428934 [Aaosphaeria arxii CBS 175.79]